MHKLLTIDDSKTIRMILQRAFKEYDCALIEAANGEEGLKAAAEHKPDLIILDITMPTMDGIQMLTLLRARGDTTPVFALTAAVTTEDFSACLAAGMTGVLSKPLRVEKLAEVLAALPGRAPSPLFRVG